MGVLASRQFSPDNTGVIPDGDVITTDPETGTLVDLGKASDF